mgnify:CR=1 FL=1
MTSQGSSHSCRAAPIEASHFLHGLGFDTLRVSNPNLIDLVAWKEGRVVFLAVKRSRSDWIAKYSFQVFQMVDAVRDIDRSALSTRPLKLGMIPGRAFKCSI